MSEQLPDVYFHPLPTNWVDILTQVRPHPYHFEGCIRYVHESKLQEAEDIINELVLFRTECISCECKFHNNDMWHESNHKTYCTLAPYMRKRSTTNE